MISPFGRPSSWSRIAFVALAAFALALGATTTRAVTPAAADTARTVFDRSIRSVPTAATDANGWANPEFVSRLALRPEETAASMPFEIALTMRNFDELEARLAHSEIIAPVEMQARYLPLPADHERVVRWLQAEGLAVTRTDANHLAVFGRGTVEEVGRVFQTTFARVSAGGVDYTSAISPPSLPNNLVSAVRGIHGLQPYQRLRQPRTVLLPLAGTGSSLPYYPAQIARAYNANTLSQTGAGQTIAVYAAAFPKTSDLTAFWATTGVAGSLANIQFINVAGGPASAPSTGALQEATLDVEWASGLAPGAVIRVYAASENDPVADDELIQEVLADLPTQPGLHQLTISFGTDENAVDRDYIAIEAQYMAALVSGGVTVFASSGDNGALDNAKATVQTGFPASMPDVTAVGGTTLTLDAIGNVASETAWGSLANAGTSGSTGGGVSVIFNRPAWQTASGVPAGTMRLVPDVAAVADPATGGLIVYSGRVGQLGGTSLSSPIWAAWCALINQARAGLQKPPLGALNPRIYPLAGTAAFRDVTSGGNSVFRAGAGYDMCTGIGVPNVAALMQATMADNFAPVIEVQSGGRATTIGQAATFYVIATSNPAPSFKWQRRAAGASAWADLADDATFSGSTTYALSVHGAQLTMNGDQFRCVIANGLSTATSTPDALTVSAVGVSTLAGWPGWSGFADGQGSAGRFNYTGSVRVDSAGTIYVADASNHTVRKITPAGVVTTLAGAPGQAGYVNGAGGSARFNGPAGVAIDAAGNVFVADSQNYAIRKITPDGSVSTFAGNPGVAGHADGSGTTATFTDPENLTIDAAGNLYIADGAGNTVRKVSPTGVVTTLAGSTLSGTADGTGSTARFNVLAGIAVDAAGNVYVGDYNNNAVRKITPLGVVTTLAGLPGTKNFGSADGTNGAARFSGPTGLAVDATGNVFVADSFNNSIRQITPAGVVTTLAGSPSVPENIDGAFSAARFNGPADVAFDASGTMYVADGINCTIRRLALVAPAAPTVAQQPANQIASPGAAVTLTTVVTGSPLIQWQDNGAAITGATSASFTIVNLQPAAAGLYAATVSNLGGATATTPAIVGVTTTSEVIGAGSVLSAHIQHPNGNYYDQVLLTGAAEAVTTPGYAVRTSFIDLNDDIVQVEFAGAGTLSLVLDHPSGPALPVNYTQNQPYMKGHAGIVITGANETTNVLVFTVGRATAFDPTGGFNILQPISATNNPANNGSALFVGHAATVYDGVADIAFIAITSTNGKFGGLRASNASCFATQGYTGIYAPGVTFTGPVYIGDINASAAATPVFIIGSSPDTRITGGDLLQANGQPVQVSGLTQLKFTAGSTSHGAADLPAQTNKAVLLQNGADVTAQIVVNP